MKLLRLPHPAPAATQQVHRYAMATRSRYPRKGSPRGGIIRFRTRPQPYDPERSSREFAERLRASYERLRADPEAWLAERAAWDPRLVHPSDCDEFRGVIEIARDAARAVFGDRLRDFAVEHAEIYDTDIECLCVTVGIAAEENEFFALSDEYHRTLAAMLSPADLASLLIAVEFA